MKKNILLVIAVILCGFDRTFGHDFSAVCPTGQTLYYIITDYVTHEVMLTYPNHNGHFNYWVGYDKPIGDIVFPESVEFNNCTYSVIAIDYRAFHYCDGLTGDLIIPNSVITIGAGAFYGCSGFSGNLVIGNAVTTIEQNAFMGCRFDGNLVMGNSLKVIGVCAFQDCSGLTGDLIIPNTVTEIDSFAFCGCSGFTGNLIINDSITTIEESVFDGCSGLDGNLVIGKSVTSIGKNSFNNCSNLTGGLVLPDSLTKIGECAFRLCGKIHGNLTIPNLVTYIGDQAFANCGLDSLTYNATNCTYMGSAGGPALISSGFRFLTIGENVISIPNYAFAEINEYNPHFGGNLVIPESVTSIGEGAFRYCNGFTGDLIIPSSVTAIPSGAFRGCSGFNGQLVLPNSVTSIGNFAFYGCTGFLSDLIIPNSVTNIGEYAFCNCTKFSGKLDIGDSVSEIGEFAFNNCIKFNSIIVHCNYPPTAPISAFYYFKDSIPIYVPPCSLDLYRTTIDWCRFKNYLPFQLSVSTNNIEFGTAIVLQQPDCDIDAIISATPIGNHQFSGWMENGVIISMDNPYQFTVSTNRDIVACFDSFGVDDNALFGINIYPNPAKNSIVIESENLIDIEIRNMLGQTVCSYLGKYTENIIDISALPSGIYLVGISDENGKHCLMKFVKE